MPPPRKSRSGLSQHLRQLGDVGGDTPGLVTNSAGTLLIPIPILPPKRNGIEPFVRRGAGETRGSLANAWGDARPDRALGCGDCDFRFIRARYSDKSHAVRALRLVAYPANELPVSLPPHQTAL